LLTKKEKDFLLFKDIINLLNNKTHFTFDGLQNIVNLRASMNLGLSIQLKKEFPNITIISKPIVNKSKEIDPN